MSAIPLLITPKKLGVLLPNFNPSQLDAWVKSFQLACELYGINTANRVASFIGNCLHESRGLTSLEENLYYTNAARIKKVFKNDFVSEEEAEAYVKNPQKLANKVYANQGGNGNEASGDGWKYRGRGPGQLTLRNNYKAYSKYKKIDFEKDPDKILEPEYLVDSFAWFFKNKGLIPLSDEWDLKKITYKINGGYNGYEDRVKYCNHVKDILLNYE